MSNWNAAGDEFSLLMDANPLTEFVEVPTELSELRYCQMLCGAIRGALEMLHMDVTAHIVQEHANATEIRVRFIRILQESIPAGDDQ